MYGIGTEVSPSSGRLETVIRSRNAVVARFPHPNDGPVQIAGLAQSPGIDYHVKTDGNNDLDGLSIDTAKLTIAGAQAAIVAASRGGKGDRILVSPGEYAEAEIDLSSADVTLVGNGPLGSVVIKPAAGVEGMKITADDITLININIEGSSTADYALSVGTFDDDVARFRAFGCKFELGDGTNEAVRLWGCSDVRLEDNQFCWAGIGVMFRGNSTGYPTQIKILGNDFHNLAVQWIGQREAGGPSENGKVVNLRLIGNSFDNLEVGTAPTGVGIELDHAGSTGIMAGNYLAMAAHASAEIALASGILYVGNYTEEGVNTARPD